MGRSIERVLLFVCFFGTLLRAVSFRTSSRGCARGLLKIAGVNGLCNGRRERESHLNKIWWRSSICSARANLPLSLTGNPLTMDLDALIDDMDDIEAGIEDVDDGLGINSKVDLEPVQKPKLKSKTKAKNKKEESNKESDGSIAIVDTDADTKTTISSKKKGGKEPKKSIGKMKEQNPDIGIDPEKFAKRFTKTPTKKEQIATGIIRSLTYKDEKSHEEFDVPFVSEPAWYRIAVRKSSERALRDKFLEKKWEHIIADAFVPLSSYVTFDRKGDTLALNFRPQVAGTVFLCTHRMSPDIADEIESVYGVYGFTKSMSNLVVPLNEIETSTIVRLKSAPPMELSPELKLVRKNGYVSITGGVHKGRYGIVLGAKNGLIEVCLRDTERKDVFVSIDPKCVQYLPNPPEKDINKMTAKEAVESLMIKNPKSPFLKYLKSEGLLEDILYPEGRQHSYRDSGRGEKSMWGIERDRFQGGREGGRRERSIAKSENTKPPRSSNSMTTSAFEEMSRFTSSSSTQSSSFSSSPTGKMPASTSSSSTFSASPSSPVSISRSSSQDFDSFIDDILNEFASDSSNSASTSSPSFSNQKRDIAPKSGEMNRRMDNFDKQKDNQSRAKIAIDEFQDDFSFLDDIDFENNDTKPPLKRKVGGDAGFHEGKGSRKETSVGLRDTGPNMEDFPTFEEYLQALVAYEGGKKSGGLPTNKKTNTNQNSNNKSRDVIDELLESFENDSSIENTNTAPSKPSVAPSITSDLSYDGMSIKALRNHCKMKGVAISGTKEQLISRLKGL